MPKTQTRPPQVKAALSTTEKAVRDILLDLGFDDEDISPNDTLEALGLDSLDVAEFWLEVESQFFRGEELDFDLVQQLDSLQKIIGWLDRCRKDK